MVKGVLAVFLRLLFMLVFSLLIDNKYTVLWSWLVWIYVVLYVCAGFGCVCITYNKASLIQSQV